MGIGQWGTNSIRMARGMGVAILQEHAVRGPAIDKALSGTAERAQFEQAIKDAPICVVMPLKGAVRALEERRWRNRYEVELRKSQLDPALRRLGPRAYRGAALEASRNSAPWSRNLREHAEMSLAFGLHVRYGLLHFPGPFPTLYGEVCCVFRRNAFRHLTVFDGDTCLSLCPPRHLANLARRHAPSKPVRVDPGQRKMFEQRFAHWDDRAAHVTNRRVPAGEERIYVGGRYQADLLHERCPLEVHVHGPCRLVDSAGQSLIERLLIDKSLVSARDEFQMLERDRPGLLQRIRAVPALERGLSAAVAECDREGARVAWYGRLLAAVGDLRIPDPTPAGGC